MVRKKKLHLMWVSMYLARAVLIGDTIFTSPIATGDHPLWPRGGQLSREKRRRERAPGMLNLTNQFHDDSFDLFVIGHKQYFVPNRRPWSIYRNAFRDPLIRRKLRANSIVRRFCLAHAGELSSIRLFSENIYSTKWKNQRNSTN